MSMNKTLLLDSGHKVKWGDVVVPSLEAYRRLVDKAYSDAGIAYNYVDRSLETVTGLELKGDIKADRLDCKVYGWLTNDLEQHFGRGGVPEDVAGLSLEELWFENLSEFNLLYRAVPLTDGLVVWGIKNDYLEFLQRDIDAHKKLLLEQKNAAKEPQTQTAKEPQTQESKTMTTTNKLATAAKATLGTQKDAALLVAQVAVGKAGNKTVAKLVKDKLPFGMKGQADTPIGHLVIANLASFAVQNFAPDNEKAKIVSTAMVQAATLKFLEEFDFEGMIDDMVGNMSGKNFEKVIAAGTDKGGTIDTDAE